MSQLYGRGREESYTPSHGSEQNAYLVARASRPAGPQRYIAEVQTVSREVTGHPVAVMEPKKDYPTHVDGQSRRDDEFITKLQDAANRANAGKHLGINLDQVQGYQVVCEDNVCRIIQPSDHHGNSTMKDGWSMQPTTIDENNPKKAAELFNKVSNWGGVNGHDRGRSSDTYDGSNNNLGGRYGYNYPRIDHGGRGERKPSPIYQDYDQITGYGGDARSSTNYGDSQYRGYGSHGKPDDRYTRRNNNPQATLSGRSYNDQGDNYVGSSASKQRPFTSQGYHQPTHYVGDTHKNPSSINGNYGNSDNMVSGNHGRLDGSNTRRNNPQLAPRAGSGYTSQTENLNGSSGLNTPLSTQQGYDQLTGYGGDIHKYPSGMNGNRSNSEDGGYGNRIRQGDSPTKRTNNPHAPQAGSGYTGQAENFKGNLGLNKPLSTQQSYGHSDGKGYGNSAQPHYRHNGRNNSLQAPQGGYDYNKTRVEHDGGNKGSNQGYGYGDGINTNKKTIPEYDVYGNGYNSSSETNTVRPAGTNPTVIDSNKAIKLYNGASIK